MIYKKYLILVKFILIMKYLRIESKKYRAIQDNNNNKNKIVQNCLSFNLKRK